MNYSLGRPATIYDDQRADEKTIPVSTFNKSPQHFFFLPAQTVEISVFVTVMGGGHCSAEAVVAILLRASKARDPRVIQSRGRELVTVIVIWRPGKLEGNM